MVMTFADALVSAEVEAVCGAATASAAGSSGPTDASCSEPAGPRTGRPSIEPRRDPVLGTVIPLRVASAILRVVCFSLRSCQVDDRADERAADALPPPRRCRVGLMEQDLVAAVLMAANPHQPSSRHQSLDSAALLSRANALAGVVDELVPHDATDASSPPTWKEAHPAGDPTFSPAAVS
jgi:hypothetical protein